MNKAVFLDRDGVINFNRNYISRIRDLKYKKEIFSLLRHCVKKGYLLIIITNQSGVGRGIISKKDLEKIHRYILAVFRREKIDINRIYYCPSYDNDNYFRKPNPGMLLKARRRFNISMKDSILIGDSMRDIVAGKRAGVGRNILLKENITPDYCVSTLANIKGLL